MSDNKKSALYEARVLPFLKDHPASTVLEFRSGDGLNAEKLRQAGHYCHDVELYRKLKSKDKVNAAAVTRMINCMIKHLHTHGRYDVVVFDHSAVNEGVLPLLDALCKSGGELFTSCGKTHSDIGFWPDSLVNISASNEFARAATDTGSVDRTDDVLAAIDAAALHD